MKRRFWLYLLIILLVAATVILAFYPAKQNNGLKILQNSSVETNEPILADFSYSLEKQEGFLNVQTNIGCVRYEKYAIRNKEVLPGCFKYKTGMTAPDGEKCFVEDEREVCIKQNNKEIINLEMRYTLCKKEDKICSNITGNYSIYPVIVGVPRIARNV
ncbi:MAG: hypothetical protein AABX65_01830 [Nanoarchaeota archaeon]